MRISLFGIRQRPILPGRFQPSTFGTEGLNFCVRDGNRCDPFVIATGNCELVLPLSSPCFSSALSTLRSAGVPRCGAAKGLSDRPLETFGSVLLRLPFQDGGAFNICRSDFPRGLFCGYFRTLTTAQDMILSLTLLTFSVVSCFPSRDLFPGLSLTR